MRPLNGKKVLMRIEECHGQIFTRPTYVMTCDHDAFNGLGAVEFTQQKDRAMRFDSFDAATAFWNKQSTVRPLRDDGEPNKPLTACSISFEKVDQ